MSGLSALLNLLLVSASTSPDKCTLSRSRGDDIIKKFKVYPWPAGDDIHKKINVYPWPAAAKVFIYKESAQSRLL